MGNIFGYLPSPMIVKEVIDNRREYLQKGGNQILNTPKKKNTQKTQMTKFTLAKFKKKMFQPSQIIFKI